MDSIAKSCPTLCNPVDCNLPNSSVHGIPQARILEGIVMSSWRGSFQPRDWTPSPEAPALQEKKFFLITEPSREAHYQNYGIGKTWLIQGGDWLHCRSDWSSRTLSKAVGMIHRGAVALTRTVFNQWAVRPSQWWEGRCTSTRLADVCRNSWVISFWMKILISIWTLECGLLVSLLCLQLLKQCSVLRRWHSINTGWIGE